MGKSPFNIVFEFAKKQNGKSQQTIRDLVQIVKNDIKADPQKGLYFGNKLKNYLDILIKQETDLTSFYYDCYWQVLVAETPYSLDSYFQALEWNRPINERFYLPRRKQLLDIVKALEDLFIWDKYDELFLSQPPRTGKSTLVLFTSTWLLGMDSEKANLYSSAGESLVNTFYAGLTEILNDDHTYCWQKIFPNAFWDKNSFMNSKECYLDVGRKKRYHSFTGRSIDSKSLNGACDCNGVLIADDLCSDIEVAINKERLAILNLKVRNNLLSRAKMGAKILWIGTRWSDADPIGARLESLENTTKRFRIINRPALNDKDESNFDYLFGVGFSTQYYLDLRQTFIDKDDGASFSAMYMGVPVERSALLFPHDELRTYNNVLPSGEPDRKFAFVDVAWGGGDYCVMPVIYQYGNDLYCVDMVCDPSNKKITQPKIANMIIKHKLGSVCFEKNRGGDEYKEDIEKILDENHFFTNIQQKNAFAIQKKGANSKEVKIFEHAPQIKEIFYLSSKYRSNDYKKAIELLCNYSLTRKKQKDDVPDALAGCIDMFREVVKRVEIKAVMRPF